MFVIHSEEDMRKMSRDWRAGKSKVGFVPTMGSLHEGHLELVRVAKKEVDKVVVSIYVNPSQFAPGEDFDQYPRALERDMEKLRELGGVSALFLPKDLYKSRGIAGSEDEDEDEEASQKGEEENLRKRRRGGETATAGTSSHQTWISVSDLEKPLCGVSRPIFFRGVATVVAKLFHIVEPDVAVFGQKDFQQLRVIETMVEELNFAVRVVGVPIKREGGGLAMSSRNELLTPPNRVRARCIYTSLIRAKASVELTGVKDAKSLQAFITEAIESNGGRVDYVSVVDAKTLRPRKTVSSSTRCLLAVAAFFKSKHEGQEVRLIDNMVVGLKEEKSDVAPGGVVESTEDALAKIDWIKKLSKDVERLKAELRMVKEKQLRSPEHLKKKYLSARKSLPPPEVEISDEGFETNAESDAEVGSEGEPQCKTLPRRISPRRAARKQVPARTAAWFANTQRGGRNGLWRLDPDDPKLWPPKGSHIKVLYDDPPEWYVGVIVDNRPKPGKGMVRVKYNVDDEVEDVDLLDPGTKLKLYVEKFRSEDLFDLLSS
ncbi:pantothenate synthetase [Chloropicon primus]|uniref:Pantoate--beta-alanine ligase n=2 Tax=Chloropicon primus TaxID=1764295 RepID=A0A5B8MUF4_9CHLO|nr:pantothenate synthetase [Chloropicon primus]UPR03157.1 pantothenate synthetase [Chloropicon primus]|eukprot:QDZ23946.1 pantothenate synthetase [Chloropicon primus]